MRRTLNRPRAQRLGIALLALGFVALACTFPGFSAASPQAPSLPTGSPPAPENATPASPPTPTPYQPRFEPTDCRFAVPEGATPECGDLIVPEDRADPASRMIALHVAIFRSSADIPAPDPVIHLSGGPGTPALNLIGYHFREGFDAILAHRDYIVFDPRGVGYSAPALNCPERDAVGPDMLAEGLGSDAAYTLEVDAFAHCRDRLIGEGINLAAYTSAAYAADVNDLRIALGYGQVNLYAVSYGTRVALTLLRDQPEGIRSVILDSVYPPQVNLYTGLPANAERAFNALFDACAADQACDTAHPDLKNVFYALADDLNASPVMVTITDPGSGDSYDIKLTGGVLIDVLFTGLYNDEVLVTMPDLIESVRAGDYTYLSERLRLYVGGRSTGRGVGIAVQCNEEVPFSTYDDLLAAAAGVQPQVGAFFADSYHYLYTVCPAWSPVPPDPVENQPVASDIPALILAGRFDPITPPAWGHLAAQTLSRSLIYEYPNAGHWVMRSGRCPLAMSLAFLDDPFTPPDSACLAELGGPDFP